MNRIGATADEMRSMKPIRMRPITADCDFPVDRTQDISGVLPNRLFTLIPSTMTAILKGAGLSNSDNDEVLFLCRKFFTIRRDYEAQRRQISQMGTTMSLNDGRLYAQGNNATHGCCVTTPGAVHLPTDRWVRLPPVLDVWRGFGNWFARTTHGLYAWGQSGMDTRYGTLGTGTKVFVVTRPARVALPDIAADEVLEICPFDCATFMRTATGWFACGTNFCGLLGLGHTDQATAPTPVPNSRAITRWTSSNRATFAWTDDGLMACGRNTWGQLGTGTGDVDSVTTLTPVPMPPGVHAVDVVCGVVSTFILADDNLCYVAGSNQYSQMGLIVARSPTPRPLPFIVSGVVASMVNTVFITPSGPLICGDARSAQVPGAAHGTAVIRTPTPLATPWPIRRVALRDRAVMVQRSDGRGGWHARGFNLAGSLGVGRRTGRVVDRWLAVDTRGQGDVRAVCGAVDAVFFVTDRAVLAAGWNRNGQLGLEADGRDEVLTPTPITGYPDCRMWDIDKVDL